MFETTRRRVLMNLGDADSGRATLQEIKGLAGTDLDEDIAEVLSRKGSD